MRRVRLVVARNWLRRAIATFTGHLRGAGGSAGMGPIGMLSLVVQYTHARAIPTKADDGQASGQRKP